ncbi:hypothetical protein B7Z17_00875, partial [Candidatus Saccharibacteria bacterium 32-49-10]
MAQFSQSPQINQISRSTILKWLLLALFGLFVVRLFYIQVIQHGYYVDLAYNTQVSKLTLVPERGKIYALDGETIIPLVLNEAVYTVFGVPQEVEDVAQVKASLKAIPDVTLLEDSFNILADEDTESRYVVLARNLTRTQAETIQKKQLAGVGLQKGTRRVYPEGSMAAHVLGYVNNDNEGQYGFEEFNNERLKGTAGLLQSVTDVRQIPLTIGEEDIQTPARDGENVVLTIDRNIQSKAEELLKAGVEKVGATKGSIVVLDPQTGAVKAMANVPTYEPASYSKVDDYATFVNGVVSTPYENGSVIKTLTMGAGLDSGSVTINSTFNDTTGCTSVDGARICNVEEDPKTAAASMLDTLRYSLNTGVVHVLRQMGGGTVNQRARETLATYFTQNYRYGKLTGVEQANEVKGIIAGPNDGDGRNVRYANMSFGQGMDTTMIQTTAAFAAAVSGGTYYKPTLIKGTLDAEGNLKEKKPLVVEGAGLSAKAS